MQRFLMWTAALMVVLAEPTSGRNSDGASE